MTLYKVKISETPQSKAQSIKTSSKFTLLFERHYEEIEKTSYKLRGIFAKYVSDIWLLYRMCKDLSKLSNNKELIKNGQNI